MLPDSVRLSDRGVPGVAAKALDDEHTLPARMSIQSTFSNFQVHLMPI